MQVAAQARWRSGDGRGAAEALKAPQTNRECAKLKKIHDRSPRWTREKRRKKNLGQLLPIGRIVGVEMV